MLLLLLVSFFLIKETENVDLAHRFEGIFKNYLIELVLVTKKSMSSDLANMVKCSICDQALRGDLAPLSPRHTASRGRACSQAEMLETGPSE